MNARSRPPAGFSLLEILLAVGMLAVALTALAQLAAVGRRHLDGAANRAQAMRLAANELERYAAGVQPLENRDAQPLLDAPDWECRVEILPLGEPGLAEVRVGVRPLELAAAGGVDVEGGWFTWARWLPYTDARTGTSWAPQAARP
jgi:type II secretory pathway pseudopilin PulG